MNALQNQLKQLRSEFEAKRQEADDLKREKDKWESMPVELAALKEQLAKREETFKNELYEMEKLSLMEKVANTLFSPRVGPCVLIGCV